MDFAKVSVEIRQRSGKGAAHKVRAAGKVPGVVYGRRSNPISVSFDGRTLLKSMDKEKRRNTVFALTVTDGSKSEEVTAMIKDAQIDPLSNALLHVDFLRVDLEQEVHVTVPLLLTGKPVGVVAGGQLHQSMHDVAVAAKPAAIPTRIEVDVTALEIGQAVHVSDLKLGAGVRALIDGREAVASVMAPKAERGEAEAAPAEGATPAAAEGAAAAGDKAAGGDKGAAAAPKKEEKKK